MRYTRYRHLAIDGAKGTPTAHELSAVETLLGATLPDSFRQFLNVASGGTLEYVIDVPMGNGRVEKMSFCSIFSADEGDFCDETLMGEIRAEREYAKIPEGVLPFARDGGGSMVYLDLSTEGRGRVVAFVEGLPAWTGRREESAFIEVASSFDEYVRQLRIDREDVIGNLADVSNLSHVEATEEWLDIGLPEWKKDEGLRNAVEEARRRLA